MKKISIVCLILCLFSLLFLFACGEENAVNPEEYNGEEIVVTFLNDDNSVLFVTSSQMPFVPSYGGETPKKPADENYFYFFDDWDKKFSSVYKSCEFKAVYRKEDKYTVTVNRADKSVEKFYFCLTNRDEVIKQIKLTKSFIQGNMKISYYWKDNFTLPDHLELKDYNLVEIREFGVVEK